MVCVANFDGPAVFGQNSEYLSLAAKELLFKGGDRKTHIYRVERGVICLYDPRWKGDKSSVEFVFPGEFFGLGFLDSHTLTACAFVNTSVECLPLELQGAIAAADPMADAKLAEAIEREFEVRRVQLSETNSSQPLERVAALLVNLSCSNRYEGRDPHLITDSWDCGTVADMLGLSVEGLADILIELARLNLVEPDRFGGLRLIDIDGLEEIADRPVGAPSQNMHVQRQCPPKLPEAWPVAA